MCKLIIVMKHPSKICYKAQAKYLQHKRKYYLAKVKKITQRTKKTDA